MGHSIWVKLRVFICFCLSHCESQCESQKLDLGGNINYQFHFSHKCHDTNHVEVYCSRFKTLDSSKVWHFFIFCYSQCESQVRWIPIICSNKNRCARLHAGEQSKKKRVVQFVKCLLAWCRPFYSRPLFGSFFLQSNPDISEASKIC